jgi:hypothetical protein
VTFRSQSGFSVAGNFRILRNFGASRVAPNSLPIVIVRVTIIRMKEDGPTRPRLLFLFMADVLIELQQLSAAMHAKATIVIDDGYACVRFKRPRQCEEIIHDRPAFGSATRVDVVVAQLLKALGTPWLTNGEFIQRLRERPAAFARVQALLAEFREIKRDVLAPVEDIEPRLASPRSSLNPYFMEAEGE